MGLRAALDAVEPVPSGRRALLARIAAAPTTEAIIEQVIGVLAETARLLWPIWFTNVSLPGRDDALGRLSVAMAARDAAREITGLSPNWAEAAARVALAGRSPRVGGRLPAFEIAQLALAISRFGLVLVADVEVACKDGNPGATVHALEWIAQHLNGAVVALFPELPPNAPPFDRILYGARTVAAANPARLRPSTPDPGSRRGEACRIPRARSSDGSPKRSAQTRNSRRCSCSISASSPSAARGRRSIWCGAKAGSRSSSTVGAVTAIAWRSCRIGIATMNWP